MIAGRAMALLLASAATLSAPDRAHAESATAGLTPAAAFPVAFKNSALDVNDATLAFIAKAHSTVAAPSCYWIASGQTPDEAEAVRAALGESGFAVERIAVTTIASPAQARAFCEPPQSVQIAFNDGETTLSSEARDTLDLAALAMANGSTDKTFLIEGFARAGESDDPIRLALERAIVARAWLVARGVAPSRMTFKSDEGDKAGVLIKIT